MGRRGKVAANGRVRTIGYVRVSTEKQADRGVSLDVQQAKVVAYAQLYDLELVEVIEEQASAKTLARPGLQKALTALKRGEASALLVVKLDRLTRRVRDLGYLFDEHFGPNGAALMSVGDNIDTRTASGRLALNVLASVLQWERESISERTSAALRHMQREGKRIGGASQPYGYRLDADGVHLAPVEHERAAIERARSLRGAGLSLSAVARTLSGEGHMSRKGTPFAPMQVSRMLSLQIGHSSQPA